MISELNDKRWNNHKVKTNLRPKSATGDPIITLLATISQIYQKLLIKLIKNQIGDVLLFVGGTSLKSVVV